MLTMACLMMLLPGDCARSLGDYLREAMDALPGTTNEHGQVYPDVVLAGFETVREVDEVSETDNSGVWAVDVNHYATFHSPTERTITTTRRRFIELRFEWRGQDRTFIDSEILWTKTRKLVLKQDWVEEIVP